MRNLKTSSQNSNILKIIREVSHYYGLQDLNFSSQCQKWALIEKLLTVKKRNWQTKSGIITECAIINQSQLILIISYLQNFSLLRILLLLFLICIARLHRTTHIYMFQTLSFSKTKCAAEKTENCCRLLVRVYFYFPGHLYPSFHYYTSCWFSVFLLPSSPNIQSINNTKCV